MITLFDTFELDLKYIIIPIIYIAIGVIVFIILKKVVNHIFLSKIDLKKNKYKKRAETLRMMTTNVMKYIIIFFVILAILPLFGVNVQGLIAGLGITAAIIGLAFQDIAKDFLAGFFIILEAQYEVGDTIEIGDFKGEVTKVGLKTTRIKDIRGRTKIIANHNITEVINYNLEDSVAIVDIGVSYEEQLDRVEKALNEVAEDLSIALPNIKEDVKVLGITSLDDSEVTYRLTATVSSMEQYASERIMRKKIKEKLDKEGIKIPYPQIEVHHEK